MAPVTSNNLKSHYDEMFSSNDGELYEPLRGLDLKAHNRRMELLDQIELPDLAQAVVVDYGVGSWGFGCIYPRLKECRHAIGFDISETALEKSAKVSECDPALAGKRVDFHVSLGYSMQLPDEFADVFFCGECIEHVEDTDAFLGEVYRVLKPGGVAIFTTPNRDPWVYRAMGIRWCVGFEHVALMDFEEFRESLERYFEPIDYIGFNQSFLPRAEVNLPEEFGNCWVASCRNDPEDATSLIGVVRKKSSKRLAASKIKIAEWTVARSDGSPPEAAGLLGSATGAMIKATTSLWIDVPAGMTRANIIFWAHPWSGYARIRCGDDEQVVNLYSHAGGCYRVVMDALQGDTLRIQAMGKRDARASDDQIILYRVVFASGPRGVAGGSDYRSPRSD